MRRSLTVLFTVTALIAALANQSCSRTPYERTDNGVIIRLNGKSDHPGQAVRLVVINEG